MMNTREDALTINHNVTISIYIIAAFTRNRCEKESRTLRRQRGTTHRDITMHTLTPGQVLKSTVNPSFNELSSKRWTPKQRNKTAQPIADTQTT